MPRVIVFDVNETLLDLGALDLHFRRVFGAGGVRGEWFTQVIELAIVATATNVYFDFAVVGDAALTMVAARHGVALAADDRSEILRGMRALPPHPDVRPALNLLRDAGFRLATLTNSNAEAAEAQLGHAGLRGYFEQVVSVGAGRRRGAAGREGDRDAAAHRRESQGHEPPGLIEGVRHRASADERHLGDTRAVGRLYLQGLAVPHHRGSKTAQRRACAAEQVGRRIQLVAQLARRIGAVARARVEDAPVRQQQRRRVIHADHGVARQRGPAPRRGTPPLG